MDPADSKKHRLEDEGDEEDFSKKVKQNDGQATKKRRPVEQAESSGDENFSEEPHLDSDSDSSEMDLGEDDEEEEREMEDGDLPDLELVDFEGMPPHEDDVGDIERLVGQVFRGLPINTLKLSRLIVLNNHLSTLLKDQDSEAPDTYAVSSVVNLSQPATGLMAEIAAQFKDLVSKGLEGFEPEENQKEAVNILQQFINSPEKLVGRNFGLVVLEKFVNIPTPAVWQLLTTLKEDMGFEESNYTHFFLFMKMYRAEGEVFAIEEFYEPFQALSSLKLDFPLPKSADTIPHNGTTGVPFRRLLLVGAPEFYQIIATNMNTM